VRPRDLLFVVLVWALSRAIVLISLGLASPHFEGLLHWDGAWYRDIALGGYEYVPDDHPHRVAFFPLFPLLSALLVRAGVPFIVAAPALNSLAFLVALIVTNSWIAARLSRPTARMVTLTLALSPPALFTVLAYSEGLFMMTSVLALRASEQKRYLESWAWSLLAGLTRPIAIALAIATAIDALRRRNPRALLAASGAVVGVALFAAYCWLQFGDPLAFVHVQPFWRHETGFGSYSWLLFLERAVGIDPDSHLLTRPLVLVVQAAVAVAAFIALRFRPPAPVAASLGFLCSIAEWWVFGERSLWVLMLPIGILALGLAWRRLPSKLALYGAVALAIVLLSGSTLSAERILFGVISFPIALGMLIDELGPFGYGVLPAFAAGLAVLAVRFGQFLWVA